MAAGGIGQIGIALGGDIILQHRRLGVRQVHPAHRDGDNLSARGFNRGGGFVQVLVAARAHDQAGLEALAGDLPAIIIRVRHAQPPPMK